LSGTARQMSNGPVPQPVMNAMARPSRC